MSIKKEVVQTVSSQKKQQPTSLKQSEERYQALFNSMTDMFQVFELVYDKQGKPIDCYFREVNPALERLTGKTSAQLIDKKVRDLFHFEDYWLERYHRILTTGKSESFEDYGKEFDQYYKVIAWKVGEKKVATIFTDITAQKKAENSVKKEKENQYKMLFDSMTEMVETIELIYNKEGEAIDYYIRDINTSFVSFLGKTKKELINKKASSIIGAITANWLHIFEKIERTGVPDSYEDSIKKLDGYFYVTAWKISTNTLGVSFTNISHQQKEKGQRAQELAIANIKLSFQNKEKDKRADELILANIELAFQNKEKDKRAGELLIAKEEKEERANELAIANTDLAYRNKEKDKRAHELANIKIELEQQVICLNKAAIVSETNADGTIISVNDNFCKIYGYQREELIGKSHDIVKSGKHKDNFIHDIWKTISSGEVWKGEIINKAKGAEKNEMLYLDMTITPFLNIHGKIIKYVGIQFDITAKVEQKKSLFKKTQELAVLNTKLANQNKEKDKRAHELILANKELAFQNKEKDKRAGELVIAKEEKEKRANELTIASTELAYQYKEKDKRAHELILANIEKNKHAKELAIAKELKQFIDTSNTPIFGIDTLGLINEWNQASEQITGYKKEEVLGANWMNFTPLESKKAAIKVVHLALSGKQTANFEFTTRARNNKEVILLVNSSTRRDSLGNITGMLAVGQDITELVGYRNELEIKVIERTLKLNQALEKQKELNELKTKFVSTASHEFRTPLSAINFAAGSIKKYWAKMEPLVIEKKLHKIEDQVSHMTRLLDDVLIVGQAAAGELRNNPLPMHLGEFIEEIIEEVSISQNKTHQITLIDSESLKNDFILIDEKLGRNIFTNLISNAIKYSPNSEKITVELSSEKNYTVITVTDFGIGISPSELKTIFTPFSRGQNVDLIQGTGLGLSIVKEAIEIMKGNITVKSSVGNGASFVVKIRKANA